VLVVCNAAACTAQCKGRANNNRIADIACDFLCVVNSVCNVARHNRLINFNHCVTVERYIAGWKEIEFEVMRDSVGNVIAVCSMENFDPVGVHTGDSIVIIQSSPDLMQIDSCNRPQFQAR